MTATAIITWPELVYDAQLTGRLPVVIPTGSAPLIGCFTPLPQYEWPFVMTLLHADPWVRVHAIAAAVWSSRIDAGMGT